MTIIESTLNNQSMVEWSKSTFYKRNELVSYMGQIYMALVDNRDSNPIKTTNWIAIK